MNNKLKTYLKILSGSLVFWIIAMVAHIIIRYYGVYEEQGINVSYDFNYSTFEYLRYGVIKGVIIGFLYSLVTFFMDNNVIRKLPTGLVFLTEFFMYLIVIVLAISISTKVYDLIHGTNYVDGIDWWIDNKFFWSIGLHASFFSFGLTFIKIAVERFGTKIFLKILTGQYRTPKEEKLIFMFLDLKSSTTIAEKLGHFRYSQFIQKCFIDLNSVIEKYDVEIYQYVGDEAVLTWPHKKGINKNNCIELFFAFQEILKHNSPTYKEEFGFIPEFKAGVHGGKLMSAEVGTIKKEIAYHGDVINATARIQSKCNEFQQQLIISEILFEDLNLGNDYIFEDLGELPLKGKNEQLTLIGIKK